MRNSSKTASVFMMWVAISPLSILSTSCNTDFKTPSSPTMMGSGTMQNMNHSMSMDLGPADANLDLRFIDAMIPHHQGAVDMAKDVLTKSKRPEIKKLAEDIMASQQVEIKQMQTWQKSWSSK